MDLTKKRISKIINNKKQSRRKLKERKYRKYRYSVGKRKNIHLKNKSLRFRKGGGRVDGNEDELNPFDELYGAYPENKGNKGEVTAPPSEAKESTQQAQNDIERLKKNIYSTIDAIELLKQTKNSFDVSISGLESELESLNKELVRLRETNSPSLLIKVIEKKINDKQSQLNLFKDSVKVTTENITKTEKTLEEDKQKLSSMGIEVPGEAQGEPAADAAVSEELGEAQGEPTAAAAAVSEELGEAQGEPAAAVAADAAPEEQQAIPITPSVTSSPQPAEKSEDVYTTMTTEEDSLYKTIKVIIKIPKNSNVSMINNTGEPTMSQLQKLA